MVASSSGVRSSITCHTLTAFGSPANAVLLDSGGYTENTLHGTVSSVASLNGHNSCSNVLISLIF